MANVERRPPPTSTEQAHFNKTDNEVKGSKDVTESTKTFRGKVFSWLKSITEIFNPSQIIKLANKIMKFATNRLGKSRTITESKTNDPEPASFHEGPTNGTAKNTAKFVNETSLFKEQPANQKNLANTNKVKQLCPKAVNFLNDDNLESSRLNLKEILKILEDSPEIMTSNKRKDLVALFCSFAKKSMGVREIQIKNLDVAKEALSFVQNQDIKSTHRAAREIYPLLEQVKKLLSTIRPDAKPTTVLSEQIQTPRGPVTHRVTLDEAKKMFDDLNNDTKMDVVRKQVYIPLNESIDRFLNILSPAETNIEGLNANYVDGPSGRFIAAQIPYGADKYYMNHAIFWKMAMLETNLIVDLSKPGDIEKYYPEKGDKPIIYENNDTHLSVTCIEQSEFDEKSGTVTSKYRVIDYTKTDPKTGLPFTKTLTRIHYQKWEDLSATSAAKLVGLVKMVTDAKGDKPATIHCKAGVGRTGTFITTCNLQAMKKTGPLEKPDETVKDLVFNGRKARGELFVQTPEQLHTLLSIAHSTTPIK